MPAVTCPNCEAALRDSDLAEGWCDNCGKKLPAFLLREKPEARRVPSASTPAGRVGGGTSSRDLARRPLATLGGRLTGAVLDGLLGVFPLVPLGVAVILAIATADEKGRGDPTILSWGVVLTFVCALGLGVTQMVLVSISGQTLGKKFAGTRIVNLDGSNPGFVGAVLLRSLVPGLIAIIPLVGPVFGLADILYIFSDDRRCLHDHIAGTRVIEV
jgi:uncharacterized RDD family membrane protein YckC